MLISDRASRAVVTRWLFSSKVFLFCFHCVRQGQTWRLAWGGGDLVPSLLTPALLPDAHPPAPVFSATLCGSQLESSHPQGGNRCPPQRAGGWESTTHSWASPHHCWWPGGERAKVRGVAPCAWAIPPHGKTTHLHKGHIHLVHIWPLFPVHLHTDKVLIKQAANLLILEGLLLHHVAPVAGRVPH